MAASIKIGTVNVPIIEEKHLTAYTAPTRRPPVTFEEHTTQEAFTDGSSMIANGSSTVDGVLVVNAILHGGITFCNGLNVNVGEPYQSLPGEISSFVDDITFIDAATQTPVDTMVTIGLINPPPQSSNFNYDRDTHFAAISYDFPNDATTGSNKRKGYRIFAIEHDRVSHPITHESSDRYNFLSNFWVDIPDINFVRDTDYYYDEIPDPGPENPFDPSTPDPYNPDKDDTSDLIGLPPDPPFGITSAGFVNVYNPGSGALQGLGDILFPNVASATDIVDAVIKLCETLANQNLINYVIDCHIIPVAPVAGNNANIKVGFRDTGISVPKVTSDYVNFSCGSLNIREYYGGFQDYQCTRSKLYLPFIGFVDVLPEFWQSGTISVDYKFNIIDGSFMAYVRSASSKSALAGSVIAQYGGNACIHLPLTGVNYSNMVTGLVQAGVAAASAGTSAAVLGAAYSAANTIAQGGNPQQSNGYNSTSAILGVRVPYLQIERLKPAWSTKYRHDKGLPSNIATLLDNISGYTEISDIELSGIPFTDGEIEELRGLLAEGVYF